MSAYMRGGIRKARGGSMCIIRATHAEVTYRMGTGRFVGRRFWGSLLFCRCDRRLLEERVPERGKNDEY